ncbi:hypothetical protein NLM33_35995 [Bradyrhizobium sp. CCGUVB1N3]|uniref:hypothetical protein n=1 Tax=Bradyrhizobium sp. CCGUVB1N3 TaxID=2949629 RepID=UPI0020B2662C|nr:hypothetical protein [Bradyrhizobium sp. CCGUVB1N3]MCP3475678.1 hypothetical protein [Bradyrhizobium sp. CCGUVB1N3]
MRQTIVVFRVRQALCVRRKLDTDQWLFPHETPSFPTIVAAAIGMEIAVLNHKADQA